MSGIFNPFDYDDILAAGRLSHIPLPLSGAILNGVILDTNKIVLSNDVYTKSLLHFDGTDGSTTFTDETGKTWTAYGNAQIDTAQYMFGGASGLFDGSGDYISTPGSSDFDFGSGDFTIDFWIRFNSLPPSGSIMSIAATGKFQETPYGGWELGLHNDAGTYKMYWNFYDSSGAVLKQMANAVTVTTNTWYHMAVIRSGNNGYTALNGTLSSATDFTGITQVNNNNNLKIEANNRVDMNGWIDEFRISKGIARWTSNFTPPTWPYAALATFRVTPAQLAQWKQLITYVKLNANNSATYTIKDTSGNTITGPTALSNGLNTIDISSLVSAELYKAVDVVVTLSRVSASDISPELHYVAVLVEGQDELAWRKKSILTTAPTVTHYANTITNTTGAGYLTTIINGYTAAVNVSVQIDSGTIYKYTIPTGGYVVFGGYGRRFNSSLIVKADQTAVYVEGVLD